MASFCSGASVSPLGFFRALQSLPSAESSFVSSARSSVTIFLGRPLFLLGRFSCSVAPWADDASVNGAELFFGFFFLISRLDVGFLREGAPPPPLSLTLHQRDDLSAPWNHEGNRKALFWQVNSPFQAAFQLSRRLVEREGGEGEGGGPCCSPVSLSSKVWGWS